MVYIVLADPLFIASMHSLRQSYVEEEEIVGVGESFTEQVLWVGSCRLIKRSLRTDYKCSLKSREQLVQKQLKVDVGGMGVCVGGES